MNRRMLFVILAAAAILMPGATTMRAQSTDTSGTDFWLTFPENHTGGAATLSLFIAGSTSTTGTVSIPAITFSMPFTVTAGQVTTVNIPIGAELATSDVVESKGIHVTALANITVYGFSTIQFTTDAYLGLPTPILGTDYIVLGYTTIFPGSNGSELAIVASANNTTVNITPSVPEGNHLAGVPFPITLNQGQTYQLIDATVGNDLTGTLISANNPIAVFGGHQCADVPTTFASCNFLVEELTPTATWGQNFFTVPLATRMNGDTFRFLASTDSTNVSVNGAVVATLNRGKFFEQIIAGAAQVTADKPILVMQYSNGGSFDNASADPFMMIVTPAAQYLASYTVTTPAIGFSPNYVNITAQTSGVGTIKLDGTTIASSLFSPIGSSGFSGAQVPLSVGSHNLVGSVPFGTIVYGFASADGYGYAGGFSLSPIALVTAVTLAPKVSAGSVGAPSCVTATVTDQNGMPVSGVRVDFTVTGANPTTGFMTAATNGTAQFCYTGTAAGSDTVTAAVGTITDTATVTWGSVVTTPGTFTPAPGSSTTAVVQPGSTAVFTVVFTPNPGFIGPVTFSCANSSIPNTICTVSPTTVNITSTAPITLTVSLRTNCTALLPPPAPRSLPPTWGVPLSLMWIVALGGWLWSRTRRAGTTSNQPGAVHSLGWLVPSLALALLVVTWSGCGSSSGNAAIPGAPVTPTGNYTVVITGTSAMGTQSMVLNVRVI